MSNAAKKLLNTKKVKKQNLKLVQKKTSAALEEVCMSLEDILKVYPGISMESASMLSTAYSLSKKTAA